MTELSRRPGEPLGAPPPAPIGGAGAPCDPSVSTEVWSLVGGEATRRTLSEIPEVLAAPDGFVWVDVPVCDIATVAGLGELLGLESRAVTACVRRNPVPKVHPYPAHAFVVLHAPEQGDRGHVHHLELDQFIGERFLVTVHGPINPRLDPRSALGETEEVSRGLAAGTLRPGSPAELSHAIVLGMTTRLHHHLEDLTREVWELEREVTVGRTRNPETFLESMFRVRHGLLAVTTMALLDGEAYARMAGLHVLGEGPAQARLGDLADRFHHISTIAEGQKNYHQGVIEFYQTRTNTKMAIAGERLAVIAAVTLPITALSGVLGMNVIVNADTVWPGVWSAVAVMTVISLTMLVWARRQGWW